MSRARSGPPRGASSSSSPSAAMTARWSSSPTRRAAPPTPPRRSAAPSRRSRSRWCSAPSPRAAPVLVIASGANRVDEKAVAAALGEALGKADAEFVRDRTGFAIGGVAPIGHATPPVTFIDEDLFAARDDLGGRRDAFLGVPPDSGASSRDDRRARAEVGRRSQCLERCSVRLNHLRCASGPAIGQARREARCRGASGERRNAAVACRGATPKGPGPFALAGSSRGLPVAPGYKAAPRSCPQRKIPPAQMVQSYGIPLSLFARAKRPGLGRAALHPL